MWWWLAGAAILVVTMVDVTLTTLGTNGAGPISGWFAHTVWQGFLAVHRRWKSHRFLSYAGPTLLALTPGLWVGLVWLGWFLVFSSDPRSLVDPRTGIVAPVDGRIYFVGYAMFTLGNGDYAPNGALWRLLTALVTGNGLATVTVSITYLLEVVSAGVSKRTYGSYIASLGATATGILRRSWDGQRFAGLEQHLADITMSTCMLTQQHLAYPVLHYFHNPTARVAAAVRIASLHELVLLLADGVAPANRLPPILVEPLRDALGGAAKMLAEEFIEPADDLPRPPSLDALRALGIPTVSDDEFAAKVGAASKTRRALLGMLRDDGWEWDEVG